MTLVETSRDARFSNDAGTRALRTGLTRVASLDGHRERPVPCRVYMMGGTELVTHGLRSLLKRLDRSVAHLVEADNVTPADVDMVLVDAQLGSRAEAQVRELAARGFDRVVACGWNPTSEEDERFRQAGATAYVSCRLTASDLLAALERLARRPNRAPVRPAAPESTQDSVGLAGCSKREADVLTLICHGLSNQEIADELHLSINTVKTYVRGAYRKIGVTTRSRAVIWGIGHGVLVAPTDRETGASTDSSDTDSAASSVARLSRAG